MKLTAATFLAFASACASAQGLGLCGTAEQPPAVLQKAIDQTQRRLADYTIDTYVHVINTAAAEAEYTRDLVNAQLQTLADAYAGTGFTFNTISVEFYVNDTWAKCYDPFGTGCSAEYKGATRKGGYGALNLWFLSDLASRFGVLGFARFPEAEPTELQEVIDGAVVLSATLTGATTPGFAAYQEGTTTVHEVGHWLGLFHTFQGDACRGDGDLVADTPQQATPNAGCPTGADSCPNNPGLDAINNYMDYTDDVCKSQFTPGQIARMQSLYGTLRAGE